MLESIVGKYRPLSKGFLHDRIALVYPRILLGPGGMSPTFIKTQNITHVLNCAEENACPPALSAHLGARGYACMDARDDETNILDSHYARFETAMDRFLRDPSCRNVYVHCQAGMNRSATLVIAYLVRRFRAPLHGVVEHVARQRPCILTNVHFQEYLCKFAVAE